MATLPQSIENRKEPDSRLGIKSSLNRLSSVIALSYALYCANSKKPTIDYSQESEKQGKKQIALKSNLELSISQEYGVDSSTLNTNPLLQSQLEALQVGLSLIFKIGIIRFVDFPETDTKERTGGDRYRKEIFFSTNMSILDLYISSWSKDVQQKELKLWLLNTPADSQFSSGLKKLLTIFSEDTLYKLRANNQEIIFQQNGIYKEIHNGNNVIAKDSSEDVGPFRVFKSFVREGLHPYLQINSNEFSLKQGVAIQDYEVLVETSLSLSPKNIVVVNEKPKGTNHHQIDSLQVIYYGAPGTGKSFKIKSLEKETETKPIRTTFHPDSDYSTFVGAYKPTMEVVPRYESSGTQVEEKRIVYNFVPQAFLKAYVQAWAHYPGPQYLVIEEINRGNCAQIFGDLFQLLDRSGTGFSEYPIAADSDISKYLCETFENTENFALDDAEQEKINALYKDEYDNVMQDVKAGELLLLPKNLHILATMNTSDQSLFPIDSAFKRRWEWEYVPIRNAQKDWVITADGKQWDWWTFLENINKKIGSVTDSEDKKLGYFFVKPHDEHTITAETFVSKVIFYLWNDVFKDYGFSDDEFQTTDGKPMTFPMFYEMETEGQRVNEALVARFLLNVAGKPLIGEETDSIELTEGEKEKA